MISKASGISRLVLVVALLAVAGCRQPDIPALVQEVTDAERAFARTMEMRDHAAFQEFISPEAIFYAGDEALRGRAAVAEGWRRFFEGADAPFSWEPDHVDVLDSGTLALSTGPVRDPAGNVIGRFNSTWRRDASGAWRVVFDRGSPVCPPGAGGDS